VDGIMQGKKKRWLLGCGCGVLALSALAALTVFTWMRMTARVKQPGPVVEVVTYYPGMSASSIEKTITNRIERWVNQAPGVNEVTSRSLAGVSIVRVSFRNDIDIDLALVHINELAQGALPVLPPDTPPPIVLPRDPHYSEPLGVLSVSSVMVDDMELRELAKTFIRPRLISIPGVTAPVVLGGRDDKSAAPTVRFRIDGRPAVGVPIYPQRGAPRQDVYENLVDALPSMRSEEQLHEIELRWAPLAAESRWSNKLDDGLLKLYLRAPSGTRVEEMEKRVSAVERFLEKNIPTKEREAIVSEVGVTPDLSALFTANAGPMDATLLVQLAPDRTLAAAAYAGKLRRLLNEAPGFAELSVRFASHDMPTPVDVRIEGGKPEEALQLAAEIRRRLQAIPGAVDVDVAQRADDVEMDHVALRRVFNVRANIEDRDRRDVIADLRNMLQELNAPAGIEVKLVE
jgi:multidrug efflux pump subunit AcrB